MGDDRRPLARSFVSLRGSWCSRRLSLHAAGWDTYPTRDTYPIQRFAILFIEMSVFYRGAES
jgi:hypothetical protein